MQTHCCLRIAGTDRIERWPTCMILVKVESIHLLQRFVEGMDESPLSVGLLYGFVFFFKKMNVLRLLIS